MNYVKARMVPMMTLATACPPAGRDPSEPSFWFFMSMAHLVGFITSYPANWWLVSRHMKRGMLTVQPPIESKDGDANKSSLDSTPAGKSSGSSQQAGMPPMDKEVKSVPNRVLAWMSILLFGVYGLGLEAAVAFGGL